MPIYDFSSEVIKQTQTASPQFNGEIPGVRQLGHLQGGNQALAGADFLSPHGDLEEFLIPGFRALDAAMKQYWSGIRVPTKDSFRLMRVKVAGGDKSLLIWADDITEGRVKLPLAAIDRTGHEFNPQKFSPAYHAMTARYLSSRGDLVAKVYRPVPFLVNYTLTVWAERKNHIEYILYQVLTRFNPLAEFRMCDGHLTGNVQLRFGGSTDASDKEAGHDQHANVRYEITMVAEAWLPLPERILKTVLGQTQVLRERVGEIMVASLGNAIGPSQSYMTPVQTLVAARQVNSQQ